MYLKIEKSSPCTHAPSKLQVQSFFGLLLCFITGWMNDHGKTRGSTLVSAGWRETRAIWQGDEQSAYCKRREAIYTNKHTQHSSETTQHHCTHTCTNALQRWAAAATAEWREANSRRVASRLSNIFEPTIMCMTLMVYVVQCGGGLAMRMPFSINKYWR